MLLVFIALLSAILYYRYKGRLSPNEIALKIEEKGNILFQNYNN